MIKDKFTQLKKNMKGMNFREGFDYLWTYYRLPFFVAVFCSVCLISLVSGIVKSQLSKPVLRVAVNDMIDMAYGEDLQQQLEDTFPDSTGFHAPERLSVSSPTDMSNPYSPVQLTAFLSTAAFDALICDRDTLAYTKEGGLPIRVQDISSTRLGKQAEKLGISPLYYVIMTDSPHAEEADTFLQALQAMELNHAGSVPK